MACAGNQRVNTFLTAQFSNEVDQLDCRRNKSIPMTHSWFHGLYLFSDYFWYQELLRDFPYNLDKVYYRHPNGDYYSALERLVFVIERAIVL